ncbi:MAG: hypothetical protein GEU74_06135 [Nitriliruptorales bacterium]|nr:hypothetical protein [Nitriliruptorales bacterium]
MDTPDPSSVREAVEELDKVRWRWLRRPEVAAVDVGYRIRAGQLTGDLAIRVHLEHKLPKEAVPAHELFPQELGGVPVDVIEAKYEPSTSPPRDEVPEESVSRRSRVTPLMGGISIGNPRVTAGTLGAVVWSVADGTPHILSNWHVLAGSASASSGTAGGSVGQPHYQAVTGLEPHYQAVTGLEPHYQAAAGVEPHYQAAAGVEPHYQSASRGQPHYQAAAIGEPIYQPGRFDGGTSGDIVARLSDVRLDRYMDAALARLEGTRPYSPVMLGVGAVAGIHEDPHLGMVVRKSGRSSQVTTGVIDGVSLSTKIEFDHAVHWFDDQLHIVPPPPWSPDGPHGEVSDGGDSGSVWVEEGTNLAVGLHFAGERDPAPASEHAIANPMWRVAKELGFSFTPHLREAPRRNGQDVSAAQPRSHRSPHDAIAEARAMLAQALLVSEARETGAAGGVYPATLSAHAGSSSWRGRPCSRRVRIGCGGGRRSDHRHSPEGFPPARRDTLTSCTTPGRSVR